MYEITAPVEGYTGRVGPVAFADGKGATDSDYLADWFRRKGYTVRRAVARKPPAKDSDSKTPEGGGSGGAD